MQNALWSAFKKTGNPFCYLLEKAADREEYRHMAENGKGGRPPD